MASKIGKQQRKKRYSEAGVVFSEAFLARVEAFPGGDRGGGGGDAPGGTPIGAAATAFKVALTSFTTLGATYAEMESLKGLTEMLVVLARGANPDGGARDPLTKTGQRPQKTSGQDSGEDTCGGETDYVPDPAFAEAVRLFLGLLFLGNSRPLHRHVITSVRRFPPTGQRLAEASLNQEVSMAIDAARRLGISNAAQSKGGHGALRLRPTAALASINGCQPQTGMEQRVLRRAAVPAAALIAEGVHAMIDESNTGRTTPPAEMEIVHDAIAVAYCLLQRHSDVFIGTGGGYSGGDGEASGRIPLHGLNIIPAAAGGDGGDGSRHERGDGETPASDALATDNETSPAETMASLVLSLTRSLQQPTLSREAAISAGVTIAAAAGAGAGTHAYAAVLADAFFPAPAPLAGEGGGWLATAGLAAPPIDAVVLGPTMGTSLAEEAARFTPFGRLSAIRGLLTAVPHAALSARLTLPPSFVVHCHRSSAETRGADSVKEMEEREEGWALLLDGALPAICAAIESPVDAHYKFHAAAALKSALTRAKQIAEKDALSEAAGDEALDGDFKNDAMDVDFTVKADALCGKAGCEDDRNDSYPRPHGPLTLSNALSTRVLNILWANWEDPLSQTVKEVQGAFEQLLDVKSRQKADMTDARGRNAFLVSAAAQLLEKGAHCKGRYVPLAVIVPRLGARNLLELRPALLDETLAAMRDDSVCCAAGSLIGALSAKLLREMQDEERDADATTNASTADGAATATAAPSNGDGDGAHVASLGRKKKGLGRRDDVCVKRGDGRAIEHWRRWWVPSLLRTLLSPGREKNGAGNYALPALLKQDGASIVPLLEALVEGSDDNDDGHSSGDGGGESQKRKQRKTGIGGVDVSAVGGGDSVADDGGVRGDALDGQLAAAEVGGGGAHVGVYSGHAGASAAAAWGERRSAALVALLRAARSASLLDPTCLARVSPAVSAAAGRQTPYEVPTELLERAVVCRETRTRCDALEMVCIDGRKASLPGALELDLLRRALPVCLRADSAAFRNALGSMVRSLLGRIKIGTTRAALLIRQKAKRAAVIGQSDPPLGFGERFGANLKGTAAYTAGEAEETIARAQACATWTRWFVRTLLASSYPGAPYERKYMALDLLNAVAETWGVTDHAPAVAAAKAAMAAAHGSPSAASDWAVGASSAPPSQSAEVEAATLEASPYLPCLGASCTTSLLGAAVDSWDKLRVSAFNLLSRHPAPLAGMETPAKLEARMRWALALLRSPRVRESDAAALLLRLLFRKYALDLGWDVQLTPEPRATPPSPGAPAATRAETGAKLLGSMCDLIEEECLKAEKDLLAACRQSLAHGALLATRYMLADIYFASASKQAQQQLKAGLARLLSLLSRVTGVALTSISSPDGALIGTGASELHPDTLGSGSGQGAAAAAAAAAATGGVGWGSYFGGDNNDNDDEEAACDVDMDDGEAGPGESLAPKAQMVVTACWLTMKEVSLLTGELARAVPLPGGAGSRGDSDDQSDEGMLDPAQLKAAGAHLMKVLLVMKHNGAIEKTRVGLTCLGERLLRSSRVELSSLPGQWLEELFGRLVGEGQGVRDLIRRSAGIPFGFMAVFLAEPNGMPRTLLHSALTRLLDIAADDGDIVRGGGVARGQSEGVHVPQVHAFNVLRAAFQDKELSTETTSFAARGLEVSIRAFSSPHWEVRNAATLSFASLLTKVCGYMNQAATKAGGAARRAVTGDEFFHRFPTLHPFLLAELAHATDLLESAQGHVHPSLYPILALLSRLRPSAATRNRENRNLAPSAFVPLVGRCAHGRPLAVRAAAARALAPLVAPDGVAAAARATLASLEPRTRARARDSRPKDDRTQSGRTAAASKGVGAPRAGYNAAHGSLLCVRAMLAADGPAAAADPVNRAAAVAAVAEGLAACVYLAAETPVAAVAAEWLACAESTIALACLGDNDEGEGDTDVAGKLRRLAWMPSDPASFGRFVSQSGGGSAAAAAASAGASVAPADVVWVKTAARLRIKLILATAAATGSTSFTTGVQATATTPTAAIAEGARTATSAGTGDPNLTAAATATAMPARGDRAAATVAAAACLSDVPYEGRAAALKALRDAGPVAVAAALDVGELLVVLCTRVLPSETRHSCVRRGLELVAAWTKLTAAEGSPATHWVTDASSAPPDQSATEAVTANANAAWSFIEGLASAHSNERVRCAAIRCLGHMAATRLAGWEKDQAEARRHPLSGGGDGSRKENVAGSLVTAGNQTTQLASCGNSTASSSGEGEGKQLCQQVAALVSLIAAGAGSERPADTREAAAAALASSTLLARLPPVAGPDDSVANRTMGAAAHISGSAPHSGSRETLLVESTDNRREVAASGPVFGEPILMAWLTAFELMEDEDDDVRDVAAAAAATGAGVATDTQTEECLRRCFAVVAARLARWPPYERYLIRAAAGPPVKSHALREVVAGVDLVRRLFDREADNHHAEGLLLSQLAAVAVRGGALRRDAARAGLDATLTSAEEVVSALGVTPATCGGDGGGSRSNSQWAGGATNHEAAFMPVCRVFLAAWALAPACAPLSEATAARVTALDTALVTRVELGPMAGAMWSAAQVALTQASASADAGVGGVGVAAGEDDAFANLSPCFLLQ